MSGTGISFNPRARDGREVLRLAISTGDIGFNPRARDGRELNKHRFIP